MCGKGGNNARANSSAAPEPLSFERHQHHRQQNFRRDHFRDAERRRDQQDCLSAIDQVPPVVTLQGTPVWKPAEIVYRRTPQHLGTILVGAAVSTATTVAPSSTTGGNDASVDRLDGEHVGGSTRSIDAVQSITATPVLVNGSYLVTGSDSGQISVWNLHSLPALSSYRYGRRRCSQIIANTDATIKDGEDSVVVAVDTISPVTAPTAVLDTLPVPIVQIAVAPPQFLNRQTQHTSSATTANTKTTTVGENDKNEWIVAVNAIGIVYVLQLVVADDTCHSDSENQALTSHTAPASTMTNSAPLSSPPATNTGGSIAATTSPASSTTSTPATASPVAPLFETPLKNVSLKLVVAAEWNTGRMGATCLCVMSPSLRLSDNDGNDSNHYGTATTSSSSNTVIVGYASGHVEAWSVDATINDFKNQETNPPPPPPPPPLISQAASTPLRDARKTTSARHHREEAVNSTSTVAPVLSSTTGARLLWRAQVTTGDGGNGPPPSVAAIAQICCGNDEQTQRECASPVVPVKLGENAAPGNSANALSEHISERPELNLDLSSDSDLTTPVQAQELPHEYLVLTLHHDPSSSTRPSTASMVEVVNVTIVARAWSALVAEQRENQADHDDTNNLQLAAVSIRDHGALLLPMAGREIVDAASVLLEPPAIMAPSWIPSSGTNSLCSIEGSTIVAAGLADGMVVILEGHQPTLTTSRPLGYSELQWDVSASMDQVCLSYPCIGTGCVDVRSADNSVVIPHVACCLRGSVTYLIPLTLDATSALTVDESNDSPVVQALAVPQDGDEFTAASPRYVQRFAAFHLAMTGPHDTVPIMVYVWPGGIMDVFSYGLLPNTLAASMSQRDDILLNELLSNGTVEMLRSTLSMSSPCEDLELMDDWNAATKEIQQFERPAIQREDLESDQLLSFRKVLIALSEA